MRRSLPLLFAVLATACATTGPGAYNQAVGPMVPPIEAPMVEPVPNFPHPGYTPNGAGLPGERVPGPPGTSAPLSPNKRILPPTEEVGLWAADGVTAQDAPVAVLEVLTVKFEIGDASHQNFVGLDHATNECKNRVERHFWEQRAADPDFEDTLLNVLTSTQRACFVADLFKACATWHKPRTAAGTEGRRQADEMLRLAALFRANKCSGLKWNDQVWELLKAHLPSWYGNGEPKP